MHAKVLVLTRLVLGMLALVLQLQGQVVQVLPGLPLCRVCFRPWSRDRRRGLHRFLLRHAACALL